MILSKIEFLKALALWAVCFFGIGQWLFGCAPSTAQLRAWSEVERTTAIQQGLTDRAELLAGNHHGGVNGEEDKTTILQALEQIPTITTTTVTPGHPQYIDQLGEVNGEEQTITETRVDTTALAIQQLGKVALALAQRSGGSVLPQIKNEGEPTRAVYQRHPMPESNAAEVIKNVGSALKESGIVTGIVSGVLGWVAGDTIKEVVKVPSHTGDYVSLENSQNPVTTTTTETTETVEAADVSE